MNEPLTTYTIERIVEIACPAGNQLPPSREFYDKADVDKLLSAKLPSQHYTDEIVALKQQIAGLEAQLEQWRKQPIAYAGMTIEETRKRLFQAEADVAAYAKLVEDCHEAVAMSTNCEGCQIAYDKIQVFKAHPHPGQAIMEELAALRKQVDEGVGHEEVLIKTINDLEQQLAEVTQACTNAQADATRLGAAREQAEIDAAGLEAQLAACRGELEDMRVNYCAALETMDTVQQELGNTIQRENELGCQVIDLDQQLAALEQENERLKREGADHA